MPTYNELITNAAICEYIKKEVLNMFEQGTQNYTLKREMICFQNFIQNSISSILSGDDLKESQQSEEFIKKKILARKIYVNSAIARSMTDLMTKKTISSDQIDDFVRRLYEYVNDPNLKYKKKDNVLFLVFSKYKIAEKLLQKGLNSEIEDF